MSRPSTNSASNAVRPSRSGKLMAGSIMTLMSVIGRWARCVGDKGRWRRVLLKKYVAAGIRSVTDEGDDEIEGVSPAIHQTCHHWAWEVRQDILDRAWNGA
ncbi:zn2+-binding protein melusin contains chord domain protein [Venturia nashicola]|uniref:Zn2+-binding protein melusin contains chord domain protein n=1 Tax=Venturia nashicola TaxID=86259 RepID=A0A4Z1PL90_9PEZI|nr:zn2+-binding protein melusin contains chord domain protein [Venturia nashicola]